MADRWASWSDDQKGPGEGTPQRKGYQEARRQDKDKRENRRARKEGDGGGGGDQYARGDTHRAVTPKKREHDKYYKGSKPNEKVADRSGKTEARKAEVKKEEKKVETKEDQEQALKAAEEEKRRKKEEAEIRKKKEEEEAKTKQAEEELKMVTDFIAEIKERHTFRASLRDDNLAASEDRPDISSFGKLDSNLKKNTAYVKKLKNLTESQRESLIRDFKTLNLSKYIGEAAASITEAKLKMSDVPCAVQICSLLHQRYADFAPTLLENWQKVLLTKKDDKVPNPSKLRVDLRVFAELICVGVFTEKTGLQMLANQLMLLMSNDKEEHNNLSIIISFSKHCGDDYAGLISHRCLQLAEEHGMTIPRSVLLKEERKKGCQGLIKDYFGTVTTHLVDAHKQLQALDKQNRNIMQTKGELSSDRKEKHEAEKLAFSKLHANAVTLADLLDETLPELIEEEIKPDDPGGLDIYCAADKEFQYDGDTSLFEDEDTRQFYEKFPDLRAIIPGILYKDSAPDPVETEEKPEEANNEEEVDVETIEREVEEHAQEEDDDQAEEQPVVEEVEEEDIASSMKLILDSFLSTLQNCVNRELIDKAAIDFCMNMNTKANRKKLIRTLFGVHRNRYDLLPFYARLVAVLHPVMADIATELSSLLKGDFKWHVRKKDQINIESKLKTVKFIGELAKFKMFPLDELFHCVKLLLFDFSHHNIEMACALFDICGRFLYRSPTSHHRAKVYLDVMMRKKTALHLDARYVTLIENAYYYANPPASTKAEERKQRPPMHQYIRRLLFRDLSKFNGEKIIKQMRKLNWDDATICLYVTKCLTTMTNVRYNVIHCMANLLAGLAPYHEAMAIQVVDGVLEDIRLGMDINHPKLNQRRLAMVKYLGELYNYRMVDSAVIFRTLYSFISYGVNLTESEVSILDPPEHLLRIRLSCGLIQTCGQYFDRGSSKKKLDCFLIYFQRYYWYKRSSKIWDKDRPFPLDVEYLIQDTIEVVRPKLQLASSYEEASEQAAKLDADFTAKLAELLPKGEDGEENLSTITEEMGELVEGLSELTMGGTQDSDEEDDEEQMEGHSEDEGEEGQELRTGSQSGSQSIGLIRSEEEGTDTMESAADDEDEDEEPDEDVTLKTGGPKVLTCQEDTDFLSAFDKMLSDNLQQRNNETVKVPQVDIALPLQARRSHKPATAPTGPLQPGTLLQPEPVQPAQQQVMPLNFMLLTRKGNKQQLSQLNVPVSAEFAARYKEREEQERAEKERMKRVVLDIHDRQEEEDYQEMLASFARPMPLAAAHSRDRKVKFQHPKGAPDADLIFGSKKK